MRFLFQIVLGMEEGAGKWTASSAGSSERQDDGNALLVV
jgi:hypothetical protein